MDWEYVVGRVAQTAKPNDVLIELGASVPAKTAELARLVSNVVGVELQLERVPPPPAANVQYVVDDAQLLNSIADESADVVVATHILEHLVDDKMFLVTLERILKPGGWAIVSTPNRRRLTRRVIEVFTGRRRFPWWEHLREYDAADLSRLLASSPLVSSIEGVGLGLFGGPLWVYTVRCPRVLRALANYWIIELRKSS